MALDIGRALRDGFDRTTARNGGILAAVFVVFGIVNALVGQSLGRVWIEGFLDDLAENPPSLEGTDLTTAEFQDLITETRDSLAEMLPLAELTGLSLAELLGLALILAFVAETIRIVTVRVFVRSDTESIPRELVTRNLPLAVLNGFVGGIVAGVLIGIASLFLLLPGIFVAISFLFFRQEVATADKNFIEALSGSWALTSGNRIELFVLVLILVVIAPIVSLVIGLLGSSTPVALLNTAVTSVVLVYTVAVVSRAYDQLRSERAGAPVADTAPDEDDEFADIDDELLP
jgi:hypothetical protein